MSVTTLHDPSHREALWELEAAFERGDLVTLFGRCTVDYEGRAASELGPGDRLVVLKPDGSALVHTDEKRTPVNWQPPGCEHRAAVRDGRLRVRSVRESPDESLTVAFDRVHQLSAMSVTGGREVEVHGSEEDLRRRLLDHPELVEDGFEPEASERETAAGPVDLFGTDADGTPVVVELKRRRVGPAAVGQLERYVDAVATELGDGASVRGVLVAPSVTDRAAELLAEKGLELVALAPTGGGDVDGAEDADGDVDGAEDGDGDGDEVDSEENGENERDEDEFDGATDGEPLGTTAE